MRQNQDTRENRAKVWAALTLAVAVTSTGLIAIASAQENGQHAAPSKAKHCAGSAACLDGNNTGTGPGVQGSNTGTGPGVQGTSTANFGVVGRSSGLQAAVGAFNSDAGSDASGVYGQSLNGYGVYGENPNGTGYGIVSNGNALVTGEIYTGGACHSGCIGVHHQASFSARSSQPTIDDVGEGALRGGSAHVPLAPDFANVIDSSKPYVVLLTPEGDAALYVANRTANGFDVRQVGGGRSTVAFAYRIVAKPYGVRDERLPYKTLASPATLSTMRGQR
jgi:hypothetical protein